MTISPALRADSPPPTLDGVGFDIEGSGTPVVLLHSSMSSKKQWRELVQRMRSSYRLIAIDLHGYGGTLPPRQAGTFTLEDEVRLVERVVKSALGAGDRFHLVGHSYGGVIALQLAQAQPARVRSLSLFEPIPFHLLPADDPVVPELHEVRRQVEASLRKDDAGSGVASFVDYWSGRGAFAQMADERRATLCRQLPKMALELQAVAGETMRAERYQRIGAPACLIGGRESPRAAHLALSVLAGLLPRAQRFLIAAGHLAPATHPALVNPIIDHFIRSVDDRLPSWNLNTSIWNV